MAAVRRDYGTLLGYCEKTAGGADVQEQQSRDDLARKVIRAADRWRLLDVDPSAACQAAARILKLLGQHDLAWEYLTTAPAQPTGEPKSWLALARNLRETKDYEMAQRGFVAAAETEPNDPSILWEESRMLRETDKGAEAKAVLERIATGEWAEQYRHYQKWAQNELGQ